MEALSRKEGDSLITYVSFHHPVTLTQQGDEFWSATERRHERISCVDKSNHMLFAWTNAKGQAQRVKVPLTNIAFVTEIDDDKPAKEKP
jgi:hypothetical protein